MKENSDKIALMVFMAGVTATTLGHYSEMWFLAYPLSAFIALFTGAVMGE